LACVIETPAYLSIPFHANMTHWSRLTSVLGASLLLCTCLITSCKRSSSVRPDAAFTPYISAFTTGHVSATSPVLVRISDDQQWRDTATIDLQDLFHLDPVVKGTVTWYDRQTLQFQPSERLAQNTEYTVRFELGELIAVPSGLEVFTFQVTTFAQSIDVRVSDLQPLSTTDLTWSRAIVQVYTSDVAVSNDLEGCFKAVQSGRQLNLTWEHEPNGRYHRFVADSVHRGDSPSLVEFSWDGKVIGADGSGGLPFDVPAIGDLALISATTFSDGEQYATLLFSDPLDPAQDLVGRAGITGADDVRTTIDGNKLILYPQQRLSGDQQGFVSAKLSNVNGRTLGKDIVVDLLFEELKPSVRMVGKGVVLPSTDELVLPFEAVNLKAVEVRVIRINGSNVGQFLQVNALDGQRELARVGRLVSRKTISLKTADGPDLGRWNRFHLDLEQHIKAEPGAIYRVQISFDRQHAVYPCEGVTGDEGPVHERSWEDEQAEYDQTHDYWYEDEWDHGYDDEYVHSEREDPCKPSYYARNNTVARNIIASDIGLIAKRGNDGSLLIAVSDLRTTLPMSGVKLEVLDFQRQPMVSAISDREGLVPFPATVNKPFLLLASKGEQRGYLKLDDGSSLSVSELDVNGQAVDKGLKGFIYGERGVWRPGDSLYIAFMLQDAGKRLPKDHPVVLELTDPRGRLQQKHVRTNPVNGVYAFRMATADDAPTGMWGAQVHVGGTTFHKSIRIETVKPNRLKIALDLPERLERGQERDIELRSNWLHGAPARNLKTRVTVTTTAGTPSFKGMEKYAFDDLRTWSPEEEQVLFEGNLNEAGVVRFPMDLELGANAPAVLNTNIVTRVFEAGGDASMDRVTVPYYAYSSYAGIKAPPTRTSWGTLFTDTTYRFEVVSVEASGKTIAGRKLKAQIYKLNWNWWWDGSLNGTTNYIRSASVELRSEQEITTDAKGRAVVKFRIDRPDWGRFAVRVTDPASGHSSAAQVYMDWPGWEGRSRREDPEQAAMLSFNSDKRNYNVGEEVVLTIPSSGTGRALVSLETGSRVLDAVWVDLKDKETRHRFQVTADMVPNIYAHVTVVQPHANTRNDLPIRLYGAIPILVEDPATHIHPVVNLPKELRTDVPFEVEVSEKSGHAMTYTLAIVDEGLLDLTRFKTPDPWSHFHAREALGVRTWDLYDQVIGAFGRQMERVLALGGSDDAGPAAGAKANRFKPVVRYVGPFKLEPGKKAEHAFTISNYVGSVRVMVVATDGVKAYGNAERTAPVKKPLMLLATLPRVLAPGEVADLPVTVFAMDPAVKNVSVKLEPNALLVPEGPAERSIRFNTTGDQVVTFKVRVKEAIGVAKVKITATSGKESAQERIELQVRQPNLPRTEVTEIALQPGAEQRLVAAPVGVTGTNSAYVEISTIPPVDLGRRLQYLIDYPHGCLEQTTSKAFPQLFLAQVMELPDRTVHAMRANVETAIQRMVQFQRNDGSFNYWPGGDHYDNWTSMYAGHFLMEAERQGFKVPSSLRNNWLAFQRKAAREWNGVVATGWSRETVQFVQAYRLYVLGLAKQQELPSMNRLRDQPDLSVRTRWVLAAAYAQVGRTDVARTLVQGQETTIRPYTNDHRTYGSDLRDEALVIDALLKMGDLPQATGLVQRIAKRLSSDDWYSTQSTAFGLLAVARLAERAPVGKGMDLSWTEDGKAAQQRHSDKAIMRTDLAAPDGKRGYTLRNTGKGLLYVRLVRTGTPLAGEESANSSNLSMDIKYVGQNGNPIDPTTLTQGSDLTAVVTIKHPGTGQAYEQLALTQIFPSGWEIRNTRLEGTEANVPNGPFTYQDIRDDRVLTYFNLWKGSTVTFRVRLNAAYTGRYYLPSPTCEAMYDNLIYARGKGQWVQVVPGDDVATSER